MLKLVDYISLYICTYGKALFVRVTGKLCTDFTVDSIILLTIFCILMC